MSLERRGLRDHIVSLTVVDGVISARAAAGVRPLDDFETAPIGVPSSSPPTRPPLPAPPRYHAPTYSSTAAGASASTPTSAASRSTSRGPGRSASTDPTGVSGLRRGLHLPFAVSPRSLGVRDRRGGDSLVRPGQPQHRAGRRRHPGRDRRAAREPRLTLRGVRHRRGSGADGRRRRRRASRRVPGTLRRDRPVRGHVARRVRHGRNHSSRCLRRSARVSRRADLVGWRGCRARQRTLRPVHARPSPPLEGRRTPQHRRPSPRARPRLRALHAVVHHIDDVHRCRVPRDERRLPSVRAHRSALVWRP